MKFVLFFLFSLNFTDPTWAQGELQTHLSDPRCQLELSPLPLPASLKRLADDFRAALLEVARLRVSLDPNNASFYFQKLEELKNKALGHKLSPTKFDNLFIVTVEHQNRIAHLESVTSDQKTKKLKKIAKEQTQAIEPLKGRSPQIISAILLALDEKKEESLRPDQVSWEDLTTLTELEILNEDTRGNFLPLKQLKENDLKGLTNLRDISIDCSEFRDLPENLFEDLPLLKTIKLRAGPYTPLKKIPENLFQGLPHIQTIRLLLFEIKSIPETLFSNLESLSVIEIENVKIKTLPPNLFQGLKNLRALTMRFDNLNELPQSLLNDLKLLNSFELNFNNGSSDYVLDIPEGFFNKTRRLKNIELAGADIGFIPKTLFHDLKFLETIDLFIDRGDEIDDSYFRGLPAIHLIRIDYKDVPITAKIRNPLKKSTKGAKR